MSVKLKTNFLNFRVISGLAVAFVLAACGGGGGSGSDGADPGVLEVPIAFIKRPIPTDNQGDPVQLDLREPRFFTEGGDVYIRDNSSAVADETNITRSVTDGMGDVKGLNASFDGKRLVFSLRLFDPNPNDDDTPTWNIYEYDLDLNQLRRVISSDLAAEEGDDLFPSYLADGRIVFTSSRQRQSAEILSNEGRPRFSALDEDEDTIAMVLHAMNDDGSDIRQISFNQSHDLSPVVMSNRFDGQILFSRWDNAAANNEFNLYKTNPDGSDMELLYGAHSHNTGTNNTTIQYSGARETFDGDIMVITKPFQGTTFGGGDIVIIDTDSFVDNQRPLWSLNGLLGPAENAATTNNITNDNSISPNGRYASAFPIWDSTNRILVSKSTCQIDVNGTVRPCIEPWFSDPAAVEVSPAYGIWVYDVDDQTEKVVVKAEQDMVMTEVLALQARTLPNVIFDKDPADINTIWRDEGVGVVNIKSVYDFGDETFNGCFVGECTSAAAINSVNDLGDPARALADERPARFVRFVKAVALPDEDDPTLLNPPDLAGSAFGPRRNLGMREIVGYAPVAPDGSVKVKVPSNIPLAIEVLDNAGRRIGPRHENWIQVRPGDSLTCTGCHSHSTNNNAVPFVHHRSDANAPSINSGLPASLVFANTQIPGTTDVYWGNLGQTMAEVRFDRVGLTVPPSAEPQLIIDVRYDDVWTDPAVRALDTSFEFLYANLDPSIISPASTNCAPWNSKCRSVISYERTIHPIWQLDRGADGNANGVGDDTCTECHTIVDAAMAPRVADAQLDLTDGVSDINADRFKSYQELFFTDAGEELDMMGALVNIQIEVDVLDGDGNVIGTEFIDDPAARVFGTMSVNGARSSYFIEKMTETELEAGRNLSTPASDPNYIDHTGFLLADELRLISEWIDIGAQYFNDPFDPAAPQN